MPESSIETELESLHGRWSELSNEERVDEFRAMPADEAQEFFYELSAADQSELLLGLGHNERRLWVRILAPDDAIERGQNRDDEGRA